MKKTAIALLVSTLSLTGAAASADATTKSEPTALPQNNLVASASTGSFHALGTATSVKNGIGETNLGRSTSGPQAYKKVVTNFTPNNVTKISIMGYQWSTGNGNSKADVTYTIKKKDGTPVTSVTPSGGNYISSQFYKVFSVKTSEISGKEIYIEAHNNDSNAQVKVNVDVYWDYNT
ncbi:hypothetical protein OQZ55_11495 [Bacillus subtilis]|uniref:hypothetical protein n=1 Tax=Bacillus subtilis TaxID=1423 RepID=UPI001E5AD349|nr:hypothetical protein [Bacillus subtilis]MCT6513304.1 hypothetical protein [Bacillus subtilis]MCX4076823.1 hypothetical protein [Bacillus subtilis]MEC0434472.1 hypothetical protein [Bacillus subtilis]WRU03850.1 hypothetical protein VDS58_11330 [Bacillus subtilis]